jgi:hypothetical protein
MLVFAHVYRCFCFAWLGIEEPASSVDDLVLFCSRVYFFTFFLFCFCFVEKSGVRRVAWTFQQRRVIGCTQVS